MKCIGVLLVAGVIALAGCKKDEKTEAKKDPGKTDKVDPKDPKKVVHGKVEGPGTGGGDKQASGTKDSKPGSGKAADDPVARGAYLANLAGCVGCHTGFGPNGPAMDKMWAGGLKVTEKPFGTWISPNITPHPETGIGKWTDEQVMAAIREGKRLDGTQIPPIMPWPLYNRLTDDDAKALVAFLRTLPPIDNKVERGDMKMPPMPEMKPANAPVGDDPIARGEYLATIMHCVMCHTAMTEKGPDMANAWAGGFVMEMPPEFEAMGTGTLITPNITSHPDNGIGKWTEADIIKAVKTAQRPDGRPIFGPMMMYVPMWSQMTDEDAMALAKFIKSIPPNDKKVEPGTFKPAGGPPGGPPPAP